MEQLHINVSLIASETLEDTLKLQLQTFINIVLYENKNITSERITHLTVFSMLWV